VRGHRECEPNVHPARVTLHGRVDELLDAGELDDVGELALDLPAFHAEDRAVQEDVLAAGQLGVEARTDLEQAADAAADDGAAARRRRDPRQHLEQRRLPGAVAPDHAEDFALAHAEAHVAERPDLLSLLRLHAAGEPAGGARHRVPERSVGRLHLPDAVALRQFVGFDRDGHQIVSAKRGS
jgi:hypothetical protein